MLVVRKTLNSIFLRITLENRASFDIFVVISSRSNSSISQLGTPTPLNKALELQVDLNLPHLQY